MGTRPACLLWSTLIAAAVAACGSDGGESHGPTPTPSRTPTPTPSAAVRAWAVAERSVLRSDDAGASWTAIAANVASERLNAIAFFDRTHGWATEAFPGRILRTEDGGLTWEDQSASIEFDESFAEEFNPRSVVALGRTSAIAVGGEFFGFGSFGLIFRTDDGGRRWLHVPIAPSPARFSHADLLDVCIGSMGIGVAAGFSIEVGQTVAVTNDGGHSWTDVTGQSEAGGPIAVACAGERNLWVISGGGFGHPGRALSHSTDGGATWTRREDDLPRGVRLFSLTFPEATHGWGAGLDGIDSPIIVHTRDRGATWTVQFQSPGVLRSIVFPTPLIGLVAGDGIVVTSDGGSSYASGMLPAGVGMIGDVAAVVGPP